MPKTTPLEELEERINGWVNSTQKELETEDVQFMRNGYTIKLNAYNKVLAVINTMKPKPKNIELWGPEEGEYVWFYNDVETLRDLVLAKFKDTVFDTYYGYSVDGRELPGYYMYCQPFIGTLPTLNKG